jgi:hypothetical protein
MIFNTFDPNQDVVAGRVTRVASGFWPNDSTNWAQNGGGMVDDFWSLTSSANPSPSYGTSYYDVRRTMYYLNVFPGASYYPNDPYFSIAYGNIDGNLGSGSFVIESASIQTSPTKAIYTQYKNMLLGTEDLDGMFTMLSGSPQTTVNASDIWVIDFSAYKMKDRIDEGLLEFSLSGSNGMFTFIDDSPFTLQNQTVYEIIGGAQSSLPSSPTYEGLGLFYPTNGVIVLNAALMAAKLGILASGSSMPLRGVGTDGPSIYGGQWIYNPGIETNLNYTYNHKTLYTSLAISQNTMKVRKSEYVPARHYFIRIKNRDFNYSNNPTYVYDGTDGIHSKGTIRNADFINDPRTYITTVGLYDSSNELVAVAKLSRPAVKDFSSELLIKVRLDF